MIRRFLKVNTVILPVMLLSMLCLGMHTTQAAEENTPQDPGQCLKALNEQAKVCAGIIGESAATAVTSGVINARDKTASLAQTATCKSACTRISCTNLDFFKGCISLCGEDNPNIKNCIAAAKNNGWTVKSLMSKITNKTKQELQAEKALIEQQMRALAETLQQIRQQVQSSAAELAKRGAAVQRQASQGMGQIAQGAKQVAGAPRSLATPSSKRPSGNN